MAQANNTWWVYPKTSVKSNTPWHPCYCSPHSGQCLPLPSEVSAHQFQRIVLELCLQRCRHAHVIRLINLCVPIVMHKMQEPRTVSQSNRKATFWQYVKEELYILAVLRRVHMEGQRGSDTLRNSLTSKLSETPLLYFKNCDILGAAFLRKALTSVLSMISFDTETAAVTTHFKKLFRGGSRELNLALTSGLWNGWFGRCLLQYGMN